VVSVRFAASEKEIASLAQRKLRIAEPEELQPLLTTVSMLREY
jgi:hypothetical protein